MKSKRQTLIQLLLFIGILFFLNVLGSRFHTSIDLTEEKRFTLTDATKNTLNELNDVVYVKVLLEGDFPAGFKRLQKGVKELLDDFRSESSYIEYTFENPMDGKSVEEINEQTALYSKSGILPTNLKVTGGTSRKESIIYPWALIFHNGRETAVNLLENETPGMDKELILNNSVSLLEYKIINGIKKVNQIHKPKIAYTAGHGELTAEETATIDGELLKSYDIVRFNLDSIYSLSTELDVLIVAKPMQPFSDKDNFKIDQYVMNGGKVLWMIDKVGVSIDSVGANGGAFVPLPMELNLDNILYNYGARIQPNLVLDMECMPIELRTGMAGNAGDYEIFPWYYHPALATRSNHPVVKNLNRVLTYFPNRIDEIEVRKGDVRKEVLLTTSENSRFQRVPTNIDFEILRQEVDPSKFNKEFLPVALLLEGIFPSEFENKVTENMLQGLKQLNLEFKKLSEPTRQIVIADGDIAADQNNIFVNSRVPLGMNPNVNLRARRDQNFLFGNKQFLLNAIEYLVDDNGVIEARSKEVKLRPLNKTRTKEEKTYWQIFNILVPIILLGIFGIFYNWNRRRKYGKA